MSIPNKFPGKCRCGSAVVAGAGSCSKQGGRWIVTCATCSAVSERAHTGCIEWPNGMGYTPCTPEYEDAAHAARDASEDWREVCDDPRHPEHGARYEAMCRAESALTRLQAEGGHMGEPVRFGQRDPLTAFIGGGRVSVAELRSINAAATGAR